MVGFLPTQNFEPALGAIKSIVSEALANGIPKGTVLNVNIPKYTGEPYKGIKMTRQSRGNWEEEFDSRKDPRDRSYYWLTGKFVNYDAAKDHDEQALADYYISVVPVKSDLTAHEHLNRLTSWDL